MQSLSLSGLYRCPNRFYSVLLSGFALLLCQTTNAQSFTTFDAPNAGTLSGQGTGLEGISGDQIIGTYKDSAGNSQGFVYNRTTQSYTLLNDPNAVGPVGSLPLGISGNNIAGFYVGSDGNDHGFIYNGSTYTTVNYPGANYTDLDSLDGNIVGGSKLYGGFLYNNATNSFQPFNYPGAPQTQPDGILGNQVVGYYDTSINSPFDPHGFWFDGTSFHTITGPSGETLFPRTFFENYLIGYFDDAANHSHGFEYDTLTGTVTTLPDVPGAIDTDYDGVYGNIVVGSSTDSQGVNHGFIYDLTPNATPEPGNVALLVSALLAGSGFFFRQHRRRILSTVPQR